MEIDRKNPEGKPPDPVVEAYVMRYGLKRIGPAHLLTSSLCCQLSRCKSDEARRLILGVS
jgi:hypothetical protein